MRRLLAALLGLVVLASCSPPLPPLVVERVNAHLFRFRQPQSAAEWDVVLKALGPGAVVVKLNDPGEGPAGFSDDYAAAHGATVLPLAMNPRGDGPLFAQLAGEFTQPDPAVVARADAAMCDPSHVEGVHCTHAKDRTGYEVARERVRCEGWSAAAAKAEWAHHAQYPPYGTRVPSPGLEAAWDEFVEARRGSRPEDR